MASSANFSVTTGAAVLLATGRGKSTEVNILANTATNLLYIGGSAVASTTGFLVGTLGSKITLHLDNGETIYGIAVTGTVDVRVLVSYG